MTVYVFFEGATEEKVVAKVCQAIAAQRIKANGRDNINPRLRETLGPLIGQAPIRALVLHDLDAHEGETPERIVQSLSNALRNLFDERDVPIGLNMRSLDNYQNVFVWSSIQPDVRIALHIATHRWNQSFVKATIDDYILGLALKPSIANALAQRQRLEIDPERLIKIVTKKIPALLRKNGIPLIEAKDYVRLYAAVIKAHTSPSVFAEKTLSHATYDQIRASFAPLLAALESLEEL